MTITVDPNPIVSSQPVAVSSSGHAPGEEVTVKWYDDPNLSEPLGEPEGTYTGTADSSGVLEFSIPSVNLDADTMGLTSAAEPGWDDVTVVHVVAGDS